MQPNTYHFNNLIACSSSDDAGDPNFVTLMIMDKCKRLMVAKYRAFEKKVPAKNHHFYNFITDI